MWSKGFWLQAAERAAKSAAQALIGMWTLDAFNTLNSDYQLAFGIASGAAVLSVLSSVITAGVGEKDSPSAVAIDPTAARPARTPDAGPPPAL